ncbi:MAG TPA: alkaline shock response membrane anchor protein AmaP [Dehalococcoidia bacterium]|nr:alkaline shock response membrane anchor protein AmaP [Dehalococcoidia bacterium]
MDAVNRAAIVAGALLLVFAAFVVIVLTWGAPEASVGRLQDFAQWLDEHQSTGAKLITTLGALVVVLLAVAVVVLELSPSSTQTVRVASGDRGVATISTEAIAERVQREVEQTPHVVSSSVRVIGRRRAVEVELELDVDAYANLRETAMDACERARAVVHDVMGVPLAAPPRARLHYRELRVGGLAPAPRTGDEARETASVDRESEPASAPEPSGADREPAG